MPFIQSISSPDLEFQISTQVLSTISDYHILQCALPLCRSLERICIRINIDSQVDGEEICLVRGLSREIRKPYPLKLKPIIFNPTTGCSSPTVVAVHFKSWADFGKNNWKKANFSDKKFKNIAKFRKRPGQYFQKKRIRKKKHISDNFFEKLSNSEKDFKKYIIVHFFLIFLLQLKIKKRKKKKRKKEEVGERTQESSLKKISEIGGLNRANKHKNKSQKFSLKNPNLEITSDRQSQHSDTCGGTAMERGSLQKWGRKGGGRGLRRCNGSGVGAKKKWWNCVLGTPLLSRIT